jgi:fluoroacetyl-CoA thioesterase
MAGCSLPPVLEPGRRATARETVTDELTAARLGSGDVDVYATPALLALVERAAVDAIADGLAAGWTTVGARVELDHLAPTPLGTTVEASATLTAVDGRRLTFAFEAADPAGTVARGTHLRVLVERAPFEAGARERRA